MLRSIRYHSAVTSYNAQRDHDFGTVGRWGSATDTPVPLIDRPFIQPRTARYEYLD